MLSVKKFYYVDCKELFFSVMLKDFPCGSLPIIWHNQGMYRLIPLAIVTNALQLLKDTKKIFTDDNTDYVFTWTQSTSISLFNK